MLKTKLFTGERSMPLSRVHEYQRFISDNPSIEIVAVNIISHDYVLLTYIETK